MANDSPLLAEMFMFHMDLITYSLDKMGLMWIWTQPVRAKRYFRPAIGDAILRYRNSFDEQFRTRIRTLTPKALLVPGELVAFVETYATLCFKKCSSAEMPRKFFNYSAFLVDLSVFCCRYNRPELIERAVFFNVQLCDRFLPPVTDGTDFWIGLRKVAEWETVMSGHR